MYRPHYGLKIILKAIRNHWKIYNRRELKQTNKNQKPNNSWQFSLAANHSEFGNEASMNQQLSWEEKLLTNSVPLDRLVKNHNFWQTEFGSWNNTYCKGLALKSFSVKLNSGSFSSHCLMGRHETVFTLSINVGFKLAEWVWFQGVNRSK